MPLSMAPTPVSRRSLLRSAALGTIAFASGMENAYACRKRTSRCDPIDMTPARR